MKTPNQKALEDEIVVLRGLLDDLTVQAEDLARKSRMKSLKLFVLRQLADRSLNELVDLRVKVLERDESIRKMAKGIVQAQHEANV